MNQTRAIAALSALAQPTRLSVFRKLIKAGPGGLPAGDLAALADVPHNTMSTHLAILSRSGLVGSRREGRSVIYSANLEQVSALLSFLISDCCAGHPEICEPLAEIADAACCPPAKRKRSARRSYAREPA